MHIALNTHALATRGAVLLVHVFHLIANIAMFEMFVNVQ